MFGTPNYKPRQIGSIPVRNDPRFVELVHRVGLDKSYLRACFAAQP